MFEDGDGLAFTCTKACINCIQKFNCHVDQLDIRCLHLERPTQIMLNNYTNQMYIASSFLPGMLHGSLLAGKIFLTPSNKLVGHKIRHKACKETTSFIPNGRVTVQGEGCKDYRTEWSISPAIGLPALQSIIPGKMKLCENRL